MVDAAHKGWGGPDVRKERREKGGCDSCQDEGKCTPVESNEQVPGREHSKGDGAHVVSQGRGRAHAGMEPASILVEVRNRPLKPVAFLQDEREEGGGVCLKNGQLAIWVRQITNT